MITEEREQFDVPAITESQRETLIAYCLSRIADSAEFSRAGIALKFALAALIQPASPALSLPDGWVALPRKLTADNGAKSALIGEFKEECPSLCPECAGGDEIDDCETCDGSGSIYLDVPVSWTTIKNIWDKAVEHFAPHTAPIEPICATGGSEWVKCSERMPQSKPGMWSKEVAAVSDLGDVFKLSAMGQCWQRSKAFVESGAEKITHWMPLPEDT